MEAIETALLSKRVDLIETKIAPAVKGTDEQANDDLDQMDSRWNERTERIVHLREEQRKSGIWL